MPKVEDVRGARVQTEGQYGSDHRALEQNDKHRSYLWHRASPLSRSNSLTGFEYYYVQSHTPLAARNADQHLLALSSVPAAPTKLSPIGERRVRPTLTKNGDRAEAVREVRITGQVVPRGAPVGGFYSGHVSHQRDVTAFQQAIE